MLHEETKNFPPVIAFLRNGFPVDENFFLCYSVLPLCFRSSFAWLCMLVYNSETFHVKSTQTLLNVNEIIQGLPLKQPSLAVDILMHGMVIQTWR